MIDEAKTKFCLSIREMAGQINLSYPTLMRWKQRLAAGKKPIEQPGPKKVKPLDLGKLKERIRDLDHGTKRSRGSGRLYRDFNGAISRRELNRMVEAVRNEINRQRVDETCHITWLHPNLAWAMDDCQQKIAANGEKIHLHNLSDLCSRYKFQPLAAMHLPCGEEVAGHLSRLFACFGPPLFCKRDNGGNLNHTTVDQALAEAMVIPINSPAYTAPYNGAIEHTQGEFKSYFRLWNWKAKDAKHWPLLAETAAHDLNHKPRRCLKGQNACVEYFTRNRLRYPKRHRQQVFQFIQDLAARISLKAGMDTIVPAAWRVASRKWLVLNKMIRIELAGKVLPDFPSNLCHN